MTLTKKTILIIATAQILLTAAFFLVVSTVLLRDFSRIERDRVSENTRRTINAFDRELTALDIKFTDWGSWDDMYQ